MSASKSRLRFLAGADEDFEDPVEAVVEEVGKNKSKSSTTTSLTFPVTLSPGSPGPATAAPATAAKKELEPFLSSLTQRSAPDFDDLDAQLFSSLALSPGTATTATTTRPSNPSLISTPTFSTLESPPKATSLKQLATESPPPLLHLSPHQDAKIAAPQLTTDSVVGSEPSTDIHTGVEARPRFGRRAGGPPRPVLSGEPLELPANLRPSSMPGSEVLVPSSATRTEHAGSTVSLEPSHQPATQELAAPSASTATTPPITTATTTEPPGKLAIRQEEDVTAIPPVFVPSFLQKGRRVPRTLPGSSNGGEISAMSASHLQGLVGEDRAVSSTSGSTESVAEGSQVKLDLPEERQKKLGELPKERESIHIESNASEVEPKVLSEVAEGNQLQVSLQEPFISADHHKQTREQPTVEPTKLTPEGATLLPSFTSIVSTTAQLQTLLEPLLETTLQRHLQAYSESLQKTVLATLQQQTQDQHQPKEHQLKELQEFAQKQQQQVLEVWQRELQQGVDPLRQAAQQLQQDKQQFQEWMRIQEQAFREQTKEGEQQRERAWQALQDQKSNLETMQKEQELRWAGQDQELRVREEAVVEQEAKVKAERQELKEERGVFLAQQQQQIQELEAATSEWKEKLQQLQTQRDTLHAETLHETLQLQQTRQQLLQLESQASTYTQLQHSLHHQELHVRKMQEQVRVERLDVERMQQECERWKEEERTWKREYAEQQRVLAEQQRRLNVLRVQLAAEWQQLHAEKAERAKENLVMGAFQQEQHREKKKLPIQEPSIVHGTARSHTHAASPAKKPREYFPGHADLVSRRLHRTLVQDQLVLREQQQFLRNAQTKLALSKHPLPEA